MDDNLWLLEGIPCDNKPLVIWVHGDNTYVDPGGLSTWKIGIRGLTLEAHDPGLTTKEELKEWERRNILQASAWALDWRSLNLGAHRDRLH